jgi:hypothetical protein
MKKILLISAILLSAVWYKSEAQVSVNINIGRQPVWGPVGYDYVNYYYLPDLGVYYDVPRGLFVYFDFGRWNFAPSLPAMYGHYDLYHSYKVVINDRNPWMRNNYYYSHYRSYRGRYQPVIRDSRDNRYFAARDWNNHKHYDNGRYSDYDGYRGGKHGKVKYDKWGNYKHDNGRRGHKDRD